MQISGCIHTALACNSMCIITNAGSHTIVWTWGGGGRRGGILYTVVRMGSAALAVAAAVLPREGDPIFCWVLMNEILKDKTVLDKVLLQMFLWMQCSHADISLRMSYD